jgi:hypothetical protein
MASGHVNRVKRPNTWLHRPMLQNVKKALANLEPSTHDPQQNSRSGCLFFRTAHECSITTQCLRSPAGRIESWRRGAGSRSPTIGRRALR